MAGVTPIDYVSPLTTAPQVNPAQAVAQGMQVGNGLIDAQRQTTLFNQAQQDRQRAIDAATQQAIAAAKAQAQMRADLDAAAADGSVESNLALMAKYPQLAEGLKKRHDALSEQRKADAIRQNVTMSAAISNGEPLVAADYARRDAAALEKTDPAAAESLRRMADLIDAHPEKANVLLQSYVMANGGKEAVEALQKAQQGQAAQQKAEADALKAETEAKVAAATALDQALATLNYTREQADRFKAQTKNEAARLGLDWAKFQFEKTQALKAAQDRAVDLPPAAAKTRDEAITGSIAAGMTGDATRSLGQKFRNLANDDSVRGRLTQFFNTGMHGQLVEGTADTFGIATEIGALKKQYRQTVNSEVLRNLPPGAASDTDVKLMREAFDNPNASFESIANGLDAMARVQERIKATEEFKAAWVEENRGLGSSRKDGEILGVPVAAGEPFSRALAKALPGGEPRKDAGKKAAAPDFSKMSDEELQRIANGG